MQWLGSLLLLLGVLIASGEGRETSRGLWWLGQGVFGGHRDNTQNVQDPEQREVFGRQQGKAATVLEDFPNLKENLTGGCKRGCQKNRPREQKPNGVEGSHSQPKHDRKHQGGESPRANEGQMRASEGKQSSGSRKSKPRLESDKRPGSVVKPLPITQGLKPVGPQGMNEEIIPSPNPFFVPHLPTELTPPPVKDTASIVDREHSSNMEGITKAAAPPTSNPPFPKQTKTSTPSRSQQSSQKSNSNSPGSDNALQSQNRGELRKVQRPEQKNQFRATPVTQRPYVRCPSAMLCIPKKNCDFNGVITEDTIADTPQLNALRVPLIPCINRAKANVVDVCCRDPNYKDSSWIENLQVADLDQTVVETDEDYQDDYYDVVADIDIRSQSKPRRGGKSGGYNGK